MSDARRDEVLALAAKVGLPSLIDELVRMFATWGCPRDCADGNDRRHLPQVCPFTEWPEDDAAYDAQCEREEAYCGTGEHPGPCLAKIVLLAAKEATGDGE